MATAYPIPQNRPREWRRRVSLRARVQNCGQWDDGHILNLSSRGMLVQYARPLNVGDTIEIRHHDRAIAATVVWRRGFRAGLRSDGPIQVIDWLESAVRQEALTSGDLPRHPTPARKPMSTAIHARSRAMGRLGEFAAICAVAAATAVFGAFTLVLLLDRPLSAIRAALSG